MIRKYILPLLAAGLVVFAIGHALYIQRKEPETPPPVAPPVSPFGNVVAGEGMVEPSTEASTSSIISIGSQLAGVVTRVAVHINQEVKAGDLLFELDPRMTDADLKVRQANVPVMQAQLHVAEANLALADDQYKRAQRLKVKDAITQQEFVSAEQAYESARANLALAKANLEMATAQVEQDKTTLALLKVQAPVDGTILQVNVLPGVYITTMGAQNLIMMGDLHPLHVRVNVDQEDLPRLKLYAPARAKLRGDPRQEEVPLSFVRLEPYVVPKTSLTGANIERVDTRVFQVIYAIDPTHHLVQERKILIGQLVDVFIDTRPTSEVTGSSQEEAFQMTERRVRN
jgi:HlyD family secretion protein